MSSGPRVLSTFSLLHGPRTPQEEGKRVLMTSVSVWRQSEENLCEVGVGWGDAAELKTEALREEKKRLGGQYTDSLAVAIFEEKKAAIPLPQDEHSSLAIQPRWSLDVFQLPTGLQRRDEFPQR